MRRYLALATAALFLSGCASLAPQSDKLLLERPSGLPAAVRLDSVPFVSQSAGYCGPATLTMAMRAADLNVSVEEVATEVYTPASKGSLQTDMIGATRRHGLLAVQIENFRSLLKEVAYGHPVIVFENLGLSILPRWHYALVTGFDLPNKNIILHSGSHAFEEEDMARFEYAWKLGKYWALVVLAPGDLAVSANELAHLTGASGLEQAGQLEAAEGAYQAILERWPSSLTSLIGLSNVAYRKGDVSGAIGFLRRAVKMNPASPVAQHNLKVAMSALKK